MNIELKELNGVDELMMWRDEVIRHVFGVTPTPELLEENRRYYEAAVPDGRHIAFMATADGEPAGCGGICFSMELPSPDNPTGRCGYLMNIYVRDRFREHGMAHTIVRRLIDEARARGCGKIYLETTEDGKPVYRSLGFQDMPDMMKLQNP